MKIRALLLLMLTCGLTACVSLKPTAHSVQRYVLGPVAAAAVQADTGSGFYVARPDLPTYLEGNRMQYRGEDGELQSLDGARWGEPLREGIARALAQQCGGQGNGFYPWPQASAQAKTLRVQLHQFGATADGQVQLVAHWQLEGTGGGVTSQGSYVAEQLTWTPGQAPSLVAGLNAALAALAQEILAER
jgi:uncharacterized lipoprotein YmbA